MKKFLAGFFKEDNGNPSMMRLIMFVIVIMVCIVLMSQVAVQIWFTHTRGTTSFTVNWIDCLTYLVFAISGKIIQKTKEIKEQLTIDNG